jgi:hypothetical protein
MHWDNKEEVLAAVNENGRELKNAAENLLDDKDVVLAAVNNFAWAIEFASNRLKDDKEIVLAAIDIDRSALRFASERLQNDIEIINHGLKKYQLYVSIIPSGYQFDGIREKVVQPITNAFNSLDVIYPDLVVNFYRNDDVEECYIEFFSTPLKDVKPLLTSIKKLFTENDTYCIWVSPCNVSGHQIKLREYNDLGGGGYGKSIYINAGELSIDEGFALNDQGEYFDIYKKL